MITKDEYSWEGNTFKNHESLNITFGNLSDWARGKIPPLAVQVMQTLGHNSTYDVFLIDGNYCSTSKWFMITTTAAQLCQSTLVIKKNHSQKVDYFSLRGEKKTFKVILVKHE